MEIILWTGVFIVGIAVLIKSSDWFIEVASEIGRFLKMPSFVIGVIIVAIGTSLPELASSISAVIQSNSQLVVGNVLGSNIANIFLVFGIAAVYGKSFTIKHDIMKTEIPFLLSSAIIITLMILDGNFTIWEAGICILGAVLYIYVALASDELKPEDPAADVDATTPGFKTWFLLILSPTLIAFSSKYIVVSIENLAALLNIASEVIAVSALALGTSLPEVMVSIQAARKNDIEIATGNVIGSNIFNIFAVMGIPGVIGKLVIPQDILHNVLPYFLGASLIFIFFLIDRKVQRYQGLILLVLYVYFIGHLYLGF